MILFLIVLSLKLIPIKILLFIQICFYFFYENPKVKRVIKETIFATNISLSFPLVYEF
jgi:hypothetical protein